MGRGRFGVFLGVFVRFGTFSCVLGGIVGFFEKNVLKRTKTNKSKK